MPNNWDKAQSLVGQLLSERWRAATKENSLRGTLRAVAGLAQESKGESPALLAKNAQSIQIVSDLLQLTSAVNALGKSEESKSYLKFLEPTEALAKAVRVSFGEGKLLDVELLVLQASVWVCNGAFVTRAGKY